MSTITKSDSSTHAGGRIRHAKHAGIWPWVTSVQLLRILAITAVLVISAFCHVNAQTIQRIYGDNYIGTVNRFELSGDNIAFVRWESTGDYTWDYFGPNVLEVHWNSPGDVYVTAIYNDLSTGEMGKGAVYAFGFVIASPFPPAAPSALVASTATPSSIVLTWTDNSTNEAGFSIERSLTSGSGFAQIGTVAANTTFYTNSGLTSGTQYYYRVRATNLAGNSAYTAQATATTTFNPPAFPGDLVATVVSYAQISLTWTDNSTDETGFKIIMLQDSGNGSLVSRGSITTGTNVTSYTDSGLSPGTLYLYRVLAFNAGGESTSTSEVSAATLPYPLAAPTNLVATTVSSTQIDLTWIDNSTNETGFQIERSLTSGSGFTLISTTAANATSYLNTGLPTGTRYYYRVRAIDAGGASLYTSVSSPALDVNAGYDRTINRSSITIVGTVTPPNAGTINSYLWEKVAGPASATLTNTQTSSLTVTNLVVGTYVFRFNVLNVYGSWIFDTITITVEQVNTSNNYVREITPLKKVVLDTQIGNLPVSDRSQSTSYFDGLGRSIQVVNWQASPNKKDIVQAVEYDSYGRETKKFLPYVSSEVNGTYKEDALTDPSIIGLPELANYRGGKQYDFYQTGGNLPADPFPYSEAIIEASPLNRIMKQGGPGNVWQPSADPSDRSIKKEYNFNVVDEVLLLEHDSNTGNVKLGDGNYYAPDKLQANKAKDEHNHEVIQYVDNDGQVILKKVETIEAGVKTYAETYYIYDDFGNLLVVLPPEATKRIKTLLIPQP